MEAAVMTAFTIYIGAVYPVHVAAHYYIRWVEIVLSTSEILFLQLSALYRTI